MSSIAKEISPDLPLSMVPDGWDGYFFRKFDEYTLHAGNRRKPFPGPEVCIDGDQLRTKEPIAVTETIVDHSKCYLRALADRERKICPAEARTNVLVYEGYFTSPLSSGVNVCLEYDNSNCRLVWRDDREVERCSRTNFKYEGIWEVGTIKKYNCTKSETRIKSHPLEYTVRYMQRIERNDRAITKEVQKQKRSVPQCDS